MPELATYLAFVAAVLAMQAVPGPDTLLVVSRGVGQGRTVAIATALVRSSPLAFEALRYLGAGYLIYLGLRLILRRRRGDAALSPVRATPRSAFLEGMISNLTNPNVLVFMLAFLPQFVDPARGSVAVQLLVLGATQKLCGLVVLAATAFAAGTVGDWIARRPGLILWQERLAGAVMIGLGVRLLAGDARAGRG
jgi:threonine/homoserine/homoserine lactone efflux protein